VNDWRNSVEDLQRLLRELPSKPSDESDIGSFEALEREISATVDRLYAGRLVNVLQSLAERASTLESLEKIEGDVKAIFHQVRNKKAREVGPTKFGSLLNQTGDCVLTVDAGTGLILDVNEVILSKLGYSREEIFGLCAQDIDEALPPSPSESWRSWVDEIKARSEPLRIERTFRCKDGSRFPVELTVFLRSVSSQDCLVFFARDITERRNIEDRLRHRARFLGQLLDKSVDGILAFDRECVVKFCSPALEKFLDVDKHEIVGRKAWEALPFLKELGEQTHFEKTLDGKKVISRDRSYTIADAEEVIFDIHYMPLLGESEEVLGGIAVVREMTRQRETERALAEARRELDAQTRELTTVQESAQEGIEQRLIELNTAKEALQESKGTLVAIFENLPDSVITVDREGQILFRNRAWPNDGSEQEGSNNFYDLVRPEDRETFRKHLEEVFLTGEPQSVEFAAVNGVRYASRLVPLIRGGSRVAAIVLSAEVTEKLEQEQAEEETEASIRAQQEREVDNLAVVADGVVRGYDRLLTDVLGHVGSILEDLPPGSSARYAIEELEIAALRATELTEQLQSYAEKDLAEAQLVDLDRLVDEMTHDLEQTVPPKVIFEKRTSGAELPIRADVGQIRELILALVGNASDALVGQQGIITLSVGTVEASREFLSNCLLGEELPAGSYVYLEVADTGKGMDEDTLARALVPFFTTKTSGSGLGLATVVGTVRRHRGAIRLKSTLYHGTTVRVVFPHRESWKSLLSRITAGGGRKLNESA
jgi:PAS domain S-box-containing protein